MHKQKIIAISLSLTIFAVFASACSTTNNSLPTIVPSTPLPTATAETIAVSATPEPGILSPKQALELMYGNDGFFPVDRQEVVLRSEKGSYTVEINTLVCYWESKTEKCLVITDYNYDECHVCSAHLDGAVFQRTYMGWRLHTFRSEIATLGSFGHVGKGELVRIGDEKYAVLIKSWYGNLGYTNTQSTIIAESENAFGVILQFFSTEMQQQYENGISVIKWGYGSDLSFARDEDNKYYDSIITYYGTNQDGETPTTQVYKFTDASYVLIDEQK